MVDRALNLNGKKFAGRNIRINMSNDKQKKWENNIFIIIIIIKKNNFCWNQHYCILLCQIYALWFCI